MAQSIDIIFEFEPFVKLSCRAFDCRHNLINAANNPDYRSAHCNLKQLSITKTGGCAAYEPIKDKKPNG